MYALKLTDTDPDLRIPPQSLLHHLETSLANFEKLLTELKCSPDDLHQTLNDPQTNELLKLKTHLATLQLKLLAIRYIPHAFERLIHLMNTSEKPEVARRAATTVLNIAGIATHTKPDQPTAPTPHAQHDDNQKEQPEATPQELEHLASLHLLANLDREGLPLQTLKDLPREKLPDLVNFLKTLTPKTPSTT